MEKKWIDQLEHFLRTSLSNDLWTIEVEADHLHIRSLQDKSIGFSLAFHALAAKMEAGKEMNAIKDAGQRLLELTRATSEVKIIKGNEQAIFPVIRSSAHPLEKHGNPYVFKEHSAESRIFYALDLGKSYMLTNETMLLESGYSKEELHDFAIANLKKLDTSYKEDYVAGNTFYFFSPQDGYAASRILNDELIAFMKRKVEKEMGLAIPHQDVLIIADIQNENGFKILARLTMDFCMKGDIPVSPLPFILNEDGSLEAIMVMSNLGSSPSIKKN